MAGIGFELRRLIERKTLSGLVTAVFSGAVIAAGPWIVSVLSLAMARRFPIFSDGEVQGLFTGAVAYTYSFSMIFLSGFLYLMVRACADAAYRKKEREAASIFFFSVKLVLLASAAVSGAASLFLSPTEGVLLFRLAFVLLFVSISVIWLCVVFLSVFRWYGRILGVYAGGMALAIPAVGILGRWAGAGGALMGFAASNFLIVAVFLIMIRAEVRGAPGFKVFPLLKGYARKFMPLIASGFLYTLGIWLDKIFNWLFLGTKVPGSFFRLYDAYDTAVFYGNLTIIPGLVFFIVWTETEFYIGIRKLIAEMGEGRYADIQAAKYSLLGRTKSSLKAQSIFQAAVTGCCMLLLPLALGSMLPGSDSGIAFLILPGIFFQLLLLTAINLLFYLELFLEAFSVSAVFLVLVAVLSLSACLSGFPAQGFAYLLGAASASLIALILLFRRIRSIDRILFLRAGMPREGGEADAGEMNKGS